MSAPHEYTYFGPEFFQEVEFEQIWGTIITPVGPMNGLVGMRTIKRWSMHVPPAAWDHPLWGKPGQIISDETTTFAPLIYDEPKPRSFWQRLLQSARAVLQSLGIKGKASP